MKNRILAIPHIGTAFGHFHRIALFLDRYVDTHKVYIIIPTPYKNYCRKFLNPAIEIICRKTHWSINNPTGLIDEKQYMAVMNEDEKIFNKVRPELLIGDPGVQAAILANKHSRKWIGLMHGCYLPFPDYMKIDKDHLKLSRLVWSVLNKEINKLVNLGTDGVFNNWAELRNTGKVIIPNLKINEPSDIGEYLDLNNSTNKSWKKHREVRLLITCCSAGSVVPSKEFLLSLAANMPYDINIAGARSTKTIERIKFLGNNINYRYLVGKETTVLTHGGHGTLQAIGKAKHVILIPGDLDQLYNSLIAHAVKGWELVFDKDWFDVINSGKLFRRDVMWDNLTVYNKFDQLQVKGLDILKEQNYSERALAS